MGERSGSKGPYVEVRAAHPQGYVEARVMAGAPADHGVALRISHGAARRLHIELGLLLGDAERRTCTCGVGPWSNGRSGRCENCGGANVPEVRINPPPGRHFTEEQLDEITDYVSKRIAARAGRAS